MNNEQDNCWNGEETNTVKCTDQIQLQITGYIYIVVIFYTTRIMPDLQKCAKKVA